MYRAREKIKREINVVNNINQMDYLISPEISTHILVTCTETFPVTDHMVGYETNLSKLKSTEVMKYVLPPQWNEIKNH
jgi:hypothetical protein